MFKTIKEIFQTYKNLRKKTVTKKENDVLYRIKHNGEILDTYIYTINSWTEKINTIVMKNNLTNDMGYRFVSKRGISTFGFKDRVDIIFCNINHSVIDFYEGIGPQKMTKYYEDAKFIYIFKNNFIKHFNIQINDIFTTKKIPQY